MNVAVLYFANYQSEALRAKRRITKNISLAGSEKIKAVCAILRHQGYSVKVLSTGKTGERDGALHSEFSEALDTSGRVDVTYLGYWAVAALGEIFAVFQSLLWMCRMLLTRNVAFIVVYNINEITLVAAVVASLVRIPIIVQYEDAVTQYRTPIQGIHWKRALVVIEKIFGLLGAVALAPSLENLERVKCRGCMLLEGTLSDISQVDEQPDSHGRYIFYGGGLDTSKGVDRLLVALEGVEKNVVITGAGPLAEEVRLWTERDRTKRSYLGVLDRARYLNLARNALVCINPHRVGWHAGGLWPFKMVEYLGYCGMVITTPLGNSNDPLMQRMWVAQDDSIAALREALNGFLSNLSLAETKRAGNRDWAHSVWGETAIASRFREILLANNISTNCGRWAV